MAFLVLKDDSRRRGEAVLRPLAVLRADSVKMKIWTSEHIFEHPWESVVQSQFRKYPNPHNTAVLGTDVINRFVDTGSGQLHSHRIITSDWALAPWVQRLIGANRECYAHEFSTVDPGNRRMDMRTTNLTFCSFVSMKEHMSYFPHPEEPDTKTVMRQETVVTVRDVPLTSYMESLIVNTVSANAAKGRRAIDWMVGKLDEERKSFLACDILDKIQSEISDLKNTVADSLIATAKSSIDDLRILHRPPIMVQAMDKEASGPKPSLVMEQVNAGSLTAPPPGL